MSSSPALLSINNHMNILINNTRSDIMKQTALSSWLCIGILRIMSLCRNTLYLMRPVCERWEWPHSPCPRPSPVTIIRLLCELSGSPALVSSIFIRHVISTLFLRVRNLASDLASWPRPPGLQPSASCWPALASLHCRTLPLPPVIFYPFILSTTSTT